MKPQKDLNANLFFWEILLLCYGALLIFLTSTSLFNIHYPSGTCDIIVKTIFKLSHIPLFSMLTFLLVRVLDTRTNFVKQKILKYYLGILGISMLFAVLTEFIQFFGPRNASIFDLFLDGLGSFLVLRVIYLRSLRKAPQLSP